MTFTQMIADLIGSLFAESPALRGRRRKWH
jgi:hypothetical protein